MPTRCWPPLRCVGLIHISGIALAIVDDRGRRNLLKALHAVLRREASCPKTRMPGPGFGGTHPRCGMPFEKPSRSRTSLCRASTTRRHSGTMWTPKRLQSGLAMRAFKKSLSKADPPQWLSSTKARSFASQTPKVSNLCDTTGAGDSFNAGYLAGRLVGMHPLAACKLGQGVAGEVIGHFGALAPEPCPGALSKDHSRADHENLKQKSEDHSCSFVSPFSKALCDSAARPTSTVMFEIPYCWRETPHALHVEIMREVEADDGAHRLPLVLQIAYPDRTALNEALASPIRARGREAKRGL